MRRTGFFDETPTRPGPGRMQIDSPSPLMNRAKSAGNLRSQFTADKENDTVPPLPILPSKIRPAMEQRNNSLPAVPSTPKYDLENDNDLPSPFLRKAELKRHGHTKSLGMIALTNAAMQAQNSTIVNTRPRLRKSLSRDVVAGNRQVDEQLKVLRASSRRTPESSL